MSNEYTHRNKNGTLMRKLGEITGDEGTREVWAGKQMDDDSEFVGVYSSTDFKEITPYDDIKPGDPVVVWNGDCREYVQVFVGTRGKKVITLMSTRPYDIAQWDNCRPLTKADIVRGQS